MLVRKQKKISEPDVGKNIGIINYFQVGYFFRAFDFQFPSRQKALDKTDVRRRRRIQKRQI